MSRDKIAEAALEIVHGAAQLTPDQLRDTLNTRLAPVIDRLVAERQVPPVQRMGAMADKPPRVEPIRRVRTKS